MYRTVVALTTLTLVAMAAPVSAQDSVTGTATMARHGGAEPCTAISWVGAMEIDGHGDMDGTYGYALSKAEDIPPTVLLDGWMRWAEYFTLYDGMFERDVDGTLVSCEPGAVLLHGYDSGVGQADGTFWDTGYIIDAGGQFEGLAGARADQLGVFDVWSDEATMPDGKPAPLGFTADLTVQPLTESSQ